jgi:hypothetical protein
MTISGAQSSKRAIGAALQAMSPMLARNGHAVHFQGYFLSQLSCCLRLCPDEDGVCCVDMGDHSKRSTFPFLLTEPFDGS